MLKKLMIAACAFVLGAGVTDAADMVRLELLAVGDGFVKLEGKLPNGMFVNEPIRGAGKKVYLYYVVLDKTQAVELKFNVSGELKLGPALCALRRIDKKNQPLSVKCLVFEFNGESAKGIPGGISKWRRMMTREFHDGDVVTLKMEFEKPEK